MLEVLRYIAYIALNACVKYCTNDQSNVKGVEGTLYRFQCLKCICVCSFPISDIFDIHSITVFDGMFEKL